MTTEVSSQILTYDLQNPPRPLSQSSFESVDMSVVHIPEGLQEELKEVWPAKCVFAVKEILTTEQTYVHCLNQMLKGYREPLCRWLQESRDGEVFINRVFLNLGELHNIHVCLVQTLKDTATDPREFGQVFVKAEEDFSAYTQYCSNFKSATELLRQTAEDNTELKNFLEICREQLGHTLSMEAYLIKPVQRITKYHLLVQQVLEHFNTEHHAYPSLKAALVAMKRIAEHINSVMKRYDNDIRVKEIQQFLCGGPRAELTYGELLLECKCKVHEGKKGTERERELFLFEKLLLFLKKKDLKRYNYKHHIEVGELKVGEGETEPTGFKVYSQSRRSPTYHVLVRSERVKQEWLEKMREAIRLNAENMKKKRLEMKEIMKRKRYSYAPGDTRMIFTSGHTRRVMDSRKRKTISEIFHPGDDQPAAQLTKISRINPELPAIRADKNWRSEREREGETDEMVAGEDEQRVPDGSGGALPVISEEEGSIFLQSNTDLLKSNRFTGPKTKMSSSVSMESLVSLSDVEIGEEEGTTVLAGLSTRYVEECDSGDVGEGSEEREIGGDPKRMSRNTSNLRRKPAIRIKKARSVIATSTPAQRSSLIREKAQLARAATYMVTGDQTGPLSGGEASETESANLIGGEGQIWSCDSSLNSSGAGLASSTLDTSSTVGADRVSGELESSSVSVTPAAAASDVVVATVTDTALQQDMGEGENDQSKPTHSEDDTTLLLEGEAGGAVSIDDGVHDDSVHDDGVHDDVGELEIVDSSDSEEEEEEEDDDEISGASMEEELVSSLDQPVFDSRQHSYSGSSHDDQTGADLQQMVLEEGTKSDSNTTGMGVEDSGFGTGDSASWAMAAEGAADQTSTAGIMKEEEEEEPMATTEPPRTPQKSAELSETLPHPSSTNNTPSPSSSSSLSQQLPKPPSSLFLARDSPGPRSLKSSSPSSSCSSLSRMTTRKSTRGFSRLMAFTRQQMSPGFTEDGVSVVQSLPPTSRGLILEEPLELNVSGADLEESPTVNLGSEEGVNISPPPAKKAALSENKEGIALTDSRVMEEAELSVSLAHQNDLRDDNSVTPQPLTEQERDGGDNKGLMVQAEALDTDNVVTSTESMGEQSAAISSDERTIKLDQEQEEKGKMEMVPTEALTDVCNGEVVVMPEDTQRSEERENSAVEAAQESELIKNLELESGEANAEMAEEDEGEEKEERVVENDTESLVEDASESPSKEKEIECLGERERTKPLAEKGGVGERDLLQDKPTRGAELTEVPSTQLIRRQGQQIERESQSLPTEEEPVVQRQPDMPLGFLQALTQFCHRNPRLFVLGTVGMLALVLVSVSLFYGSGAQGASSAAAL